MIPRILIIAGSDSGGGAGIQADIKTVMMLGGHAMTAITAITAQNTLGVQAIMPISAEMVLAQIDSVISDIGVDAIKIGMIGSADTASAVAAYLEQHVRDTINTASARPVPIVFDPVMVATSGATLAEAATIAAFERLMRIATLTTPNLPELAALGGEAAVRATGTALLVKGGHAAGNTIEDRLISDSGVTRFTNQRIDTRHSHGTGCTLASGIATALGRGATLAAASEQAIAFVRAALVHAPGIGQGSGPMGHALGRIPFDDLQAPAGADRKCDATITAQDA